MLYNVYSCMKEELKNRRIMADRKTIYSDIETLKEFNIDILQSKGTKGAITLEKEILNSRN